MEDRNLQPAAQLALDVEAFGRLDVFQVDAAEGGFERRDDLDQLVRVVLVQLEVEHIDAGELLEEHRLAFHHRLRSERPDVAEPEHRRAVGHHGHQVAAAGVAKGVRGIGNDLLAGCRHARRVGERQVTLIAQRFGGEDRNLARLPGLVILQRCLAKLRIHLKALLKVRCRGEFTPTRRAAREHRPEAGPWRAPRPRAGPGGPSRRRSGGGSWCRRQRSGPAQAPT
jgi:hypothetical protein